MIRGSLAGKRHIDRNEAMNNAQVETHPPRSGEPLFRYIAEQYQALQQEPVLYQWKINYQSPIAWYSGLGAGIAGMLFGLYFPLRDGDVSIFNPMSNILYCLGIIWVFYSRYLINANKIYHYHITAKGIYYTLQDDIPEIAFTIMRGVAWRGLAALPVSWQQACLALPHLLVLEQVRC